MLHYDVNAGELRRVHAAQGLSSHGKGNKKAGALVVCIDGWTCHEPMQGLLRRVVFPTVLSGAEERGVDGPSLDRSYFFTTPANLVLIFQSVFESRRLACSAQTVCDDACWAGNAAETFQTVEVESFRSHHCRRRSRLHSKRSLRVVKPFLTHFSSLGSFLFLGEIPAWPFFGKRFFGTRQYCTRTWLLKSWRLRAWTTKRNVNSLKMNEKRACACPAKLLHNPPRTCSSDLSRAIAAGFWQRHFVFK